MLKRLHKLLEANSRPAVFAASVFLLLVINYIDYISGTRISLGVFYLVPIAIVAWRIGRPFWFPFCVLSAATWGAINFDGVHALIAVWNTATRLVFFSVTGFLASEIREMLDHEIAVSRTDYLTGAANKRAFVERAELELSRLRRTSRPLSLAYIDVDDFKKVNDSFGHSAGDELLRSITRVGKASLRETDLLARLGGDEFALLLPEAQRDEAIFVAQKLRRVILEEAKRQGWPIDLSVGVVTFTSPVASVDELLHIADELMYTVKSSGKGRVEQQVFPAMGSADAN
jgi:diguanylate cyclase (GGDEF)-like protein